MTLPIVSLQGGTTTHDINAWWNHISGWFNKVREVTRMLVILAHYSPISFELRISGPEQHMA